MNFSFIPPYPRPFNSVYLWVFGFRPFYFPMIESRLFSVEHHHSNINHHFRLSPKINNPGKTALFYTNQSQNHSLVFIKGNMEIQKIYFIHVYVQWYSSKDKEKGIYTWIIKIKQVINKINISWKWNEIISVYHLEFLGLLAPRSPVGFTSNTWHVVNLWLDISLEVGPTHDPLTINPRHCLHLPGWVLKAHQTLLTVEHAPSWEWGKGLGAAFFYDPQVVRNYHRAICCNPPKQANSFISILHKPNPHTNFFKTQGKIYD